MSTSVPFFSSATMRNQFVSTAIGGAAGVFFYAKSLTDGAIGAQLGLKHADRCGSSLNYSVDVDPAIARSAHL